MADIKTHLRELGVLVGIKNNVEALKYTSTSILREDFCRLIDSILPAEKHSFYNNIRSITFGSIERSILKNAFALSDVIVAKFGFTKVSSCDWYGYETGKDEPYDIEVNGKFFSLKEDSFILENMGLYKLLNCYTGSKYKKRHIFEDYAASEYCKWFETTWECLNNYLDTNSNCWSYTNPKNANKKAKITKSKSCITLEYFEGTIHEVSTLPLNCKLCTFKSDTTTDTREGVFSKFINENLDSNTAYNSAKKACAVVASNNLAKELNDNLNYTSGIARFLRIHKNEYYYAKTTSSGVELYKVPSLANFTSVIEIESIVGSVPDKQANILTTIKNKKSGKKLVLRNECRFSHGQFNGTPEAKLYYEHGGSLDIIYEKI